MLAGADQFPKLFSPFSIKKMTLRNRITIPAHFSGLWMNADGVPSQAFIAYLEERAKGGAALVGIGATVVRDGDHPAYYQNVDDSIIPHYQKVSDAVHRHGAKVIAQFCPRGPDIRYKEVGEPFPRPAAAGPLASAADPGVSADWHVSTYGAEDLKELADCTGLAAIRARAGGVDGVELHAHQHHLHAQFLSPVVNRRTDEYGGSFENRTRFLVDTIRATRRAVDEDCVVGLRMWARDLHPHGWVEDDSIRVIQMLTSEGLIDYASFTAGVRWMELGPMYQPDGEFLELVGNIRSQISVPVIHAGRITNPQVAEKAIASGQVDLVGMVKAHIADPHFPKKVLEGRLEDIRFCIRCLYCVDIDGAKCIYNPETGRELEWGPVKKTRSPKRVVIVGAGPAGMEAAVAAAGRGHDVVVLEKQNRVGGDVWLAGAAPLRGKYLEIAEFYERQARKGMFELRLNTEATQESILAFDPEVVVIATGSLPVLPELPGANGKNVLVVEDVLRGRADAHQTVLVVDRTGHAPAFVAADQLSSNGVSVEFVAAAARVGEQMGELDLAGLYGRLEAQGVSFRAGLDVTRFDGNEALLRDIFTGQEAALGPLDSVVIAAGGRSLNGLASILEGRVRKIHVIGSASEPSSIMQATVDGAGIGRLI